MSEIEILKSVHKGYMDGKAFKDKHITVRDHFAGLAMHGLLQGLLASDVNHNWSDDDIAMSAYEQADAMIAERDKR